MLVGPFGLGICQWWAHAGFASGSAAVALTAAAAGCLAATGCAGGFTAAVATDLGGCTAGEACRAFTARGLVRMARGACGEACDGFRADDTCRATGRRAGAEPFDAGFRAPLLDRGLPGAGRFEVPALEGLCAGFRAVALAGFETAAVLRRVCFGAERLAIAAAGLFEVLALAVDALAGRDCAACDLRVDFDALSP